MATIGHSLLGLSLAGCSRAESRKNALRYVWPGLMVLFAHLIDLIEFAGVWIAVGSLDTHFLTHSWWSASLLVVAVFAVIRLCTRLRKPWPYVLVAAAILSHLLLDARAGRGALAWFYGFSTHEENEARFLKSIEAEIWGYGLLLIFVLLARAARRKDCPPLGRRVCGLFAAACVIAAVTRQPMLWVFAYFAAGLHAALLLRREIKIKYLWSLVPLVPLFAFVGAEVYRQDLVHAAETERIAGRCENAIAYLVRAEKFRTRDSILWLHIRLGQCYFETGDYHTAEYRLRRAADDQPPNWGQYWLAWFYANTRLKGTPYYRPAEAANLLHEFVSKNPTREMQESADWLSGRLATNPPQ